MLPLLRSDLESIIDRALVEDLGHGDVTADALIGPDLQGRAVLAPRVPGILAGVEVAAAVFRRVDSSLRVTTNMRDGDMLRPHHPAKGIAGDVIGEVEGSVASILKAERTALNFLQHLSGIATETRKYVDAVAGYDVRILDTRKTVPGLRDLAKYAVRAGGGHNHRRNLGDGILVVTPGNPDRTASFIN